MGRSKEVLIALNIGREKAGIILDILKERGFKFRVVNLAVGQELSFSRRIAALIVMGGPPSANDAQRPDKTPWMKNEIKVIRQALEANVGFLGICLGAQALAYAAGGEIFSASHAKQVGFRKSYHPLGEFFSVQLTDQGRSDPFFKGLSGTLPIFQLHGEAIRLTPTMQPAAKILASDDVIPSQVIKVGDFAYGIQGHWELTEDLLDEWLKVDPDLLALGEEGVWQVRADFNQKKKVYMATARTIFNNFLDLLP